MDTTCMPRLVWLATWNFSISPHTDQKMPKMGDTWQLLVFPCNHDEVIMKCVILCVCHILYMDPDIIYIDANVNSTNADSSLLTGLG
jgi:hypothetical protein